MTVSVKARAVSVLTLSTGQLAVDMEGVALADLVDAVNQSGGTLQIADKPGHIVTGTPLPPGASLPGICCSTAHITADDNRLHVPGLTSVPGLRRRGVAPLHRHRLPDTAECLAVSAAAS